MKRRFLVLDRWGDGRLPCGPCRRLLLERAGRLRRRLGADLVVTGEIVGRGGLTAEDLGALDRAVGLAGQVIRPLSARRLPPTPAEEAGLVDRSRFLDLGAGPEEGNPLGAQEDQAPGGGRVCLLSDPDFLRRLRALGEGTDLTENHIELLRFRHCYPLGRGALVVVALDPEEQERLSPLFTPTDVRLYVQVPRSPLALVRAPWASLTPRERLTVLQGAAERMAQAAGLPGGAGWELRFRFEWERETHRLRLPLEEAPAVTLISP
ncbi:MAG: hypothetical protein N2320_02805 [Candidatus Bipolaricaulota bacterium]|nr:hypothetical protein [Candidatus Bipolaricaulota bacterium]